MRMLALCCLVALAACYGNNAPTRNWASNAGLQDVVRIDNFTATSPRAFVYSARTNTVMTENDDGAAERIRRQWLAQALEAHGMCAGGYVIDSRHLAPLEQGRFANDSDVVYAGRCLGAAAPPPHPVSPPPAPERG
jgi:hypothetical protein